MVRDCCVTDSVADYMRPSNVKFLQDAHDRFAKNMTFALEFKISYEKGDCYKVITGICLKNKINSTNNCSRIEEDNKMVVFYLLDLILNLVNDTQTKNSSIGCPCL